MRMSQAMERCAEIQVLPAWTCVWFHIAYTSQAMESCSYHVLIMAPFLLFFAKQV